MQILTQNNDATAWHKWDFICQANIHIHGSIKRWTDLLLQWQVQVELALQLFFKKAMLSSGFSNKTILTYLRKITSAISWKIHIYNAVFEWYGSWFTHLL